MTLAVITDGLTVSRQKIRVSHSSVTDCTFFLTNSWLWNCYIDINLLQCLCVMKSLLIDSCCAVKEYCWVAHRQWRGSHHSRGHLPTTDWWYNCRSFSGSSGCRCPHRWQHSGKSKVFLWHWLVRKGILRVVGNMWVEHSKSQPTDDKPS